MRKLYSRFQYLSRMVTGLHEFLQTTPHPDPEGLIRLQLANREANFLGLMRQVVFSNPANPYRAMFGLAGCEYGDLERAVNRDGLEPTLSALHREGIYLAHDEFKLKKPIVRANREIPAGPDSFRNPLARGGTQGRSGGSRSSGTLFRTSVQARLQREAQYTLAVREFELSRRSLVVVKPILPAADWIYNTIQYLRLGCSVDAWFSPVARSFDSTHYRLATYALVAMARLKGLRAPFPSDLPFDDFSPAARWIADRRRKGISSAVFSYASPATRVAAAAAEQGLDIRDTLFLVGGETLTDAKRRVIESTGARVFPRYVIAEVGLIGCACRQMSSGDCVHVARDSVAVISYTRKAPFSGQPLESLLFTSLLPCAPFALVNAEMDDGGVLDQAKCQCTYTAMGLTQVIRDINSYGKLTGHGVTLAGTDVVRVLEEVLPARLGGTATDYQLVERDGGAQAHLSLRVSRRVPLKSREEARRCFLHELRALYGGEIASRLWCDANALEVIHEDPIPTARGKILPLHLLGSGVSGGSKRES